MLQWFFLVFLPGIFLYVLLGVAVATALHFWLLPYYRQATSRRKLNQAKYLRVLERDEVAAKVATDLVLELENNPTLRHEMPERIKAQLYLLEAHHSTTYIENEDRK